MFTHYITKMIYIYIYIYICTAITILDYTILLRGKKLSWNPIVIKGCPLMSKTSPEVSPATRWLMPMI